MREIKYYDRIHKEWLTLEVTDEVARFLSTDGRRWRKQREEIRKHEVRYDEYEEWIENIADDINIEESYIKNEFAKIVWKVVDKLEPKQRDVVKLYFIKDLKPSVIAKKFDMSRSEFTQFMQTCKKHLIYLFSNDKDFVQTEYYQNYYKSFSTDVINFAQEVVDESIINLDLQNIFDFTKEVAQTVKIADKLGVPLNKESSELLKNMTKIVRSFLKPLDKKEVNIKTPEDIKNLIEISKEC